MDKLKKLPEILKNKNNRVIFIIIIIGVLFITFPQEKKTKTVEQKPDLIQNDEERMEKIISSIKGVGKVKVMITYNKSTETCIAYDSKTKNNTDDREDEKEAIMSDGNPVVIGQIYPKVKGVVVIAEGAEDESVKKAITQAVTTAWGISSYKVCVLVFG